MDKENKSKTKKKLSLWPFKIFIVALVLSLAFSMLSEITLSKANIIISIIVILVFIVLNILFDMLGLAVASSQLEPFTAMASRKVKGSKQAIWLIKNADKVSSICCDVIGDVCGILSGAAGASILAKIVITSGGDFLVIFISSLISSIIAGITIFGKALCKQVACKNPHDITLKFAKFLNFFTRKD